MTVDPGMADANVTWSVSPTASDTVDGDIATIVCEGQSRQCCDVR